MAANEETENRRRLLRQAMGVLNDRELRVLKARRLVEEPISLQELSNELGVSHQRVHQIERRAFDKVRMAVRGAPATASAHAPGRRQGRESWPTRHGQ